MNEKLQTGGLGVHMTTCPTCKKKFIPAPEHAWQVGKSRIVCSYSCMREEERRRGWLK